MNIEIVDEIKPLLDGALPRRVGLREDGAFGLASAIAIHKGAGPGEIRKPLTLSDMVSRSRAIIAGDQRAVTEPGVTLDLAVSVIAVAAQLGRVAMNADRIAHINEELGAAMKAGHEREEALAAKLKAAETEISRLVLELERGAAHA